jgi:hypothetical protein
MIEEGFFYLVSNWFVAPDTWNNSMVSGGVQGFAVQLPKDFLASPANRQAWTYRSILRSPLYTLSGEDPLTKWEVQIDAHGYEMKDAIYLAKDITSLLSGGWQGTLNDLDSTVVNGIFQLPGFVDGYSDTNRTFVRSIDYAIWYYEQ